MGDRILDVKPYESHINHDANHPRILGRDGEPVVEPCQQPSVTGCLDHCIEKVFFFGYLGTV